MGIEYTEAYIDQLRSLIEIKGIDGEFECDPLVVDGKKLHKKVNNLSTDFGAIGSKMEEDGMIDFLNVPSNEDGIYLWADAELTASVLSDVQVKSLGVEIVSGQRIGVIENKKESKFVFYRIPETEVAELFPTVFDSERNMHESVDYVISHKDQLASVGDEAIRLGRIVYGVWVNAVRDDVVFDLEKFMVEIYGDKLTKEDTLGSVLGSLSFGLTQEADRPADNWWLARCAVLKTLDILEKDGNSYKVESVEMVRKIVAEIAYKCFYPEMLYKFVVEPLSKVNYGDGVKLLDGAEMAEIRSRVEKYSVQKKTATI